jgi:hypothetical protein
VRARYEHHEFAPAADWPVFATEQIQNLDIGKALVALGTLSGRLRIKTANEERLSFLSSELNRLTNRRHQSAAEDGTGAGSPFTLAPEVGELVSLSTQPFSG